MISKLAPSPKHQYLTQYETELIESLIIFGGFFLVKRSRFNELGAFDDELRIWAWFLLSENADSAQ